MAIDWFYNGQSFWIIAIGMHAIELNGMPCNLIKNNLYLNMQTKDSFYANKICVAFDFRDIGKYGMTRMQ